MDRALKLIIKHSSQDNEVLIAAYDTRSDDVKNFLNDLPEDKFISICENMDMIADGMNDFDHNNRIATAIERALK